ncbi:hypothetical protein [Geodermatophilus maliterrae]|uniref:Uncharacterized protein n=1 Tax=Geodermatophilus maliterrae TaxID=3162531 RepID=A0ABV3XF80_9ACTN
MHLTEGFRCAPAPAAAAPPTLSSPPPTLRWPARIRLDEVAGYTAFAAVGLVPLAAFGGFL